MARNPHPEVTERRILAAAKKLFAEKGYDKTSIQDIIDKLGDLSRGAIYHHFKSKEAIAATNDDDRDKLLAEAARKVSEDAPADWLFNYRVTTAYAKGVTGFPINLNQTLLPLYNVAYTK